MKEAGVQRSYMRCDPGARRMPSRPVTHAQQRPPACRGVFSPVHEVLPRDATPARRRLPNVRPSAQVQQPAICKAARKERDAAAKEAAPRSSLSDSYRSPYTCECAESARETRSRLFTTRASFTSFFYFFFFFFTATCHRELLCPSFPFPPFSSFHVTFPFTRMREGQAHPTPSQAWWQAVRAGAARQLNQRALR